MPANGRWDLIRRLKFNAAKINGQQFEIKQHTLVCTIHRAERQTVTSCHSLTDVNDHNITADAGVLSQTAGLQIAWTVWWVCSSPGNINSEVQHGGGEKCTAITFHPFRCDTGNQKMASDTSFPHKFAFYLWYFAGGAFELDISQFWHFSFRTFNAIYT